MRAVGVESFGGAEELTLMDAPRPEPGPGEALLRIARAGVNYIDVYMRSGVYKRSETYKTPLPMTLGMEGAGEVVAVGPGVDPGWVGRRAAYCLSRGSYAECAAVPAWRLVPIPDGVSDEIACALMLQGATAHYLTHDCAPLAPGDACLVHAAAGGVGQLLVQLAKARGATVMATAGTAEKAEIARARGADHVILYRDEDFLPRVREITGGAGVAAVYDSVGRDTVDRSLRCLRRRGTCVLFGASSGVVECVEPLALAEAGSVFFTRPHLADYMRDAAEIGARARDLFGLVESGGLTVTLDRTFPLAEAAAAHRALEGRESRGKLLLDAG